MDGRTRKTFDQPPCQWLKRSTFKRKRWSKSNNNPIINHSYKIETREFVTSQIIILRCLSSCIHLKENGFEAKFQRNNSHSVKWVRTGFWLNSCASPFTIIAFKSRRLDPARLQTFGFFFFIFVFFVQQNDGAIPWHMQAPTPPLNGSILGTTRKPLISAIALHASIFKTIKNLPTWPLSCQAPHFLPWPGSDAACKQTNKQL